MENFKFGLISVIVLAAIGLLGYWAFVTIEPGNVSAYKQREEALREENRELEKEVARLTSELETLKAERDAAIAQADTRPTVPSTTTPPPSTGTTTYKHQSLINELQKLINDNIYMKVGSKGTRVGTIQKFLNVYTDPDMKVDNDYGPSLKTAVTSYQKAVGITADGETGPATYRSMIDWLKKQG